MPAVEQVYRDLRATLEPAMWQSLVVGLEAFASNSDPAADEAAES